MKRGRFSFQYRILIYLFSLVGPLQLYAQAPSFNATVSTDKILQNSVFEVQFELKNASTENFIPPDFSPFRVVSGPAMGSSTIIINGEVSRSQSWTYSLLAPQEGKFTIGSASVVAGRKKLSSRPVTVQVIAAEDMGSAGNAIPGNEPIKLIAYVRPGEYYPGQQIILDYKLLFRENIQSVNTIAEDDYADFYVQNIERISQEATYEDINGLPFASRVIKSVALYAHQSGTYSIDPMVIMAGINAPYPGNQGFFTMRRLHNIQIASEALSIRINSLPADQPGNNFSGAVGQYTITTLPNPSTSITTDDDFILRLEIKGNGDSRRWDPPAVMTDGNFEMYDPKILEDRMTEENGAIIHSRVIEYVMLPKQPGEFNLHVPFRFFNPDTKQYETIQSESVHLTVTQGRNTPRSVLADSATKSSALLLMPVRNMKINDRFWTSFPHIFLFSLILAGTGYGLFVTYRRKKESAIPADEKKRSAASRNARHQLDMLQRSSDEMSEVQFNERITETYYKFLSEKLKILPADLDAEKIGMKLSDSGVDEDVKMEAIHFYNECLSLRYGGSFAGLSRNELLNRCRHIIDSIDDAVPHHI